MLDYRKFVHKHVIQNISQLISDLCNFPDPAGPYHNNFTFDEKHPGLLTQKDWRAAAEVENWMEIEEGRVGLPDYMNNLTEYDNWQQCCEEEHILPEITEALEHWIVSDWLANKLRYCGEMIHKDVHGLIVWGRTCSGQTIYLDGVIKDIYNQYL